jgi:hypothetical protein
MEITEAEKVIPQPEFRHHAYGVDLSWLGEDGGIVASGHIPPLRFIAACNHMARTDVGLMNIWDDPCARVADVIEMIDHRWAVAVDPHVREWEWSISWHKVTERTPGAMPVTLLNA